MSQMLLFNSLQRYYMSWTSKVHTLRSTYSNSVLWSEQLQLEERETIAEMQTVRIRGNQLKSQLAKLEYKLEMKDQLQLDTGNLHAVDYEQLKMENESLNAKASSQSLICICWHVIALL